MKRLEVMPTVVGTFSHIIYHVDGEIDTFFYFILRVSRGQDSHFRFAKRSWNQTTVQTFSGWLQYHKKAQKRIYFPVPLIHAYNS